MEKKKFIKQQTAKKCTAQMCLHNLKKKKFSKSDLQGSIIYIVICIAKNFLSYP
jgi:hypothetical protein